MRADCGNELVGEARLRQIGIAAGMLGALPNSRHDVGSDDDDRDAARLGIRFQAPAHFPPVELRHREIEHDDVRAKDMNHLDGPLTACRFVNDEAGGTERQLVDLALGIVIVNQDYRGHLASRTIRQVSRRFNTEKVFSSWSRGRESNPRPTDYESVALPLSYPGILRSYGRRGLDFTLMRHLCAI